MLKLFLILSIYPYLLSELCTVRNQRNSNLHPKALGLAQAEPGQARGLKPKPGPNITKSNCQRNAKCIMVWTDFGER